MTPTNVPAIVLWLASCLAMLVLGGYWVRTRAGMPRRLVELLGAGSRLPFGFWTEDACPAPVVALDGDPDAGGSVA